jgi:membrane protease YdiL (CAAX protease family)
MHTRPAFVTPIVTPGQFARLIAGLAVVFLLFHALASALGSDRGQTGFMVCIVVLTAILTADWVLFRQAPATGVQSLGLGRPAARGTVAALGICVVLLALIPAYAVWRGVSLSMHPGWGWLLPGLFTQAGIAEEALFRGYLFGRLRKGRGFWDAAALAAVPFVAVHLILFATLDWPVALAAVLLSTILSFPLARLFELGGNTIWPPALLHFVVQGAIKIIEIPGDAGLPIVWMAASAILPWLAFVPSPRW